MKINELISELCAEAVRPVDKEHTVDVIKVGNGDEEIKNVGTAMFATPDVIARAKANGVNFLIIHEPLFYTHFDKEMPYELCFKKKKLIEDAGITVFRFHDYPHSMSPDMIYDGQIMFSGLQGHWGGEQYWAVNRFILDNEITTLELARALEENMGFKNLRIVGSRDNTVKTIGCCFGTPGHIFDELGECDTVLTGEICEWSHGEYVRDLMQMGTPKSMIVMGHLNSEKYGMKLLAQRLTEKHPEFKTHYFDCEDIYSYTY